MPKFFIHRPIFAWVLAIFIMIAGIVSIFKLPVAQYPSIAPPTINVSANYPGASAQDMDASVMSLLERQMNGIDNLMYMSTVSESSGRGSMSITFNPGTNIDIAQVEVQNKLARIEPQLPESVKKIGLTVDKSMGDFLLVASFISTDDSINRELVSDYVSRNIIPEIQRLEGVGGTQLFSSERSMRIWLDPKKMHSLNISPTDVNTAILKQNLQVSGGSLGTTPIASDQNLTATITVSGQLSTEEEFGNIILRSGADGSFVRLKDVATIGLGLETYAFDSMIDGQPSVSMAVQLSSSGNALATATNVKNKLQELERFFPQGVQWDIPFDTSTFVKISITKVAHTLLEAIALVFLVMLLFLQKMRYTIIPTIVVPISLLGTFAILYATGMSINILAMFAMVLVIGIVVDDAIVVVENVERIMAQDNLPPKEATIKAMSQISGAVVGITLILISVFIPLALFSGAIGNIYRQFAVVMAVSIGFSGFFALTLTPALCATILKPIDYQYASVHEEKGYAKWSNLFFQRFNHWFSRVTSRYQKIIASILKRTYIIIIAFVLIIGAVGLLFKILPTSFIPEEDQGILLATVQLASGSTQEESRQVMLSLQDTVNKHAEIKNTTSVVGFNFNGQGSNVALAFIALTDWNERKSSSSSAEAVANALNKELSTIQDAFIYVLPPSPIPGLGNASGFNLMLQDRVGIGHEALLQARNQFLAMASQNPLLSQVRASGIEDAPQLQMNINRELAATHGIDMAAIAQTLGIYLGSSYVNDFPNNGRSQKVTVQANAENRKNVDDVLALTVINKQGQLIPLSTFVTPEWITGPMQLKRYNGYPAMEISGEAVAGKSSGDAMDEVEQIIAQLPEGISFEWTGISADEKKAGSQSIILYAFSILAVFLCLAALYESWSIPFSVILVVPLGVFGALIGNNISGIPNDIYFQIALITIIGLSAKNAILIVEFAKDIQAQGKSALEAAKEAAALRFRPIIMTSLAFIIGVTPLCFASGASSASQKAIGIAVFFGMLIGTFLAIFFVPTFYTIVRKYFKEPIAHTSNIDADNNR